MSSRRMHLVLVLLVLPVWAVGLRYSLQARDQQAVPHPAYLWHARYSKLAPYLDGVATAAIVPTMKLAHGRRKVRLFKAQYVLAPTVLTFRWRLPKKVVDAPLIYDFMNQAELEEALKPVVRRMKRRQIDIEVIRLGRGLALVRLQEGTA